MIGGGAWGTALAQAMASDGSGVLLWAREAELVDEINAAHSNSLFLPGITLAATIRATAALGELAPLPVLLVVTPAQHLARVLGGLPDAPRDLVLCAKGIEAGTGRLMADVAAQAAPAASIAVLSGPTFAHEVAAGLSDIEGQRLCAGRQRRLRHQIDVLAAHRRENAVVRVDAVVGRRPQRGDGHAFLAPLEGADHAQQLAQRYHRSLPVAGPPGFAAGQAVVGRAAQRTGVLAVQADQQLAQHTGAV